MLPSALFVFLTIFALSFYFRPVGESHIARCFADVQNAVLQDSANYLKNTYQTFRNLLFYNYLMTSVA